MEFISIEINVLWQTKWRETHCQIWLLSYLPIHVLVYNIFVYMIMESNQKKKLLLNYEKFCMKTIKTLNKTVFWIPVLLVPHPYLAFKLLFKLFLLPSLFFFNVWSWFNNLVFFFFLIFADVKMMKHSLPLEQHTAAMTPLLHCGRYAAVCCWTVMTCL